ncbi:MAG: Fic family protein, partial [Actinomycetota bacterium]|nr:Fic family protein [Actinomycetota bacterium]
VRARALARAESDPARAGAGTQAAEVLANVDAMVYAIDTAARATGIGLDDLLAIHKVLLEASANPAIAGRFRREQNWIGGNEYKPCGADFVPPPPELVEPLLLDLGTFVNAESLPPLAQAAIAHAQFETIHPFEDGNGRTGRALVQVILRKRGLAPEFVPPISVVLADRKDEYIRGLTEYREDRVVEWIELFCGAAARAASLASEYVTRVAELQEEWRGRLRQTMAPRRDAAVWPLIEALPAHPVLTRRTAADVVGRSSVAAGAAIDALVEAGIVTPLSESKRNRSWEASELIDLVERLEAALPPSG